MLQLRYLRKLFFDVFTFNFNAEHDDVENPKILTKFEQTNFNFASNLKETYLILPLERA